MTNAWDKAAQRDFNLMTKELGRKVLISTPEYEVNYEGEEDEQSQESTKREEIVFLQELDSTHEAIKSGLMEVGDVRLEFQADSIAVEEGTVTDGNRQYTIRRLTAVRGMNNNEIIRIRGFGKKLPNR